MGGRLVAIWDGGASTRRLDAALVATATCPCCGGNEDPCPTCTAWAALTPESTEDFLWAAEFDRANVRWMILSQRTWKIDSGPDLARLGLLERRHDGAGLTGLGLDVIHAMRRGATSA